MFISANHPTRLSTLTLSICGLDNGVHYTPSVLENRWIINPARARDENIRVIRYIRLIRD